LNRIEAAFGVAATETLLDQLHSASVGHMTLAKNDGLSAAYDAALELATNGAATLRPDRGD